MIRILLILPCLIFGQYSPELEWSYMNATKRQTVLDTRDWGAARGYPELGAHAAVESRGDTAAINHESLYGISACELQVNVHYPTVRLFGPDYSRRQFNHVRDLLIMSRRH